MRYDCQPGYCSNVSGTFYSDVYRSFTSTFLVPWYLEVFLVISAESDARVPLGTVIKQVLVIFQISQVSFLLTGFAISHYLTV